MTRYLRVHVFKSPEKGCAVGHRYGLLGLGYELSPEVSSGLSVCVACTFHFSGTGVGDPRPLLDTLSHTCAVRCMHVSKREKKLGSILAGP